MTGATTVMFPPSDAGPSSSKRQQRSPSASSNASDTFRGGKRVKLVNQDSQSSDLTCTPKPRLAPYHPGFPHVENGITRLCDDILAVYDKMKATGYCNPTVARICESVRKLRSPTMHYPVKGPIAFAGGMGVGKSALINSLFGLGEIAITSGDVRCTDVVHEYLRALPTQVSFFQVEACYHPRTRIREHVTDHCQQAFHFFEKSKQIEEDADAVDSDELDELRQWHITATEYLHTTLHDEEDPDFCSDDAIGSWLRSRWAEHTALPDVVSHIMEKIDDLLLERGVHNDIETHQAGSVDDLQEIYHMISRPEDSVGYNGVQKHPCRLLKVVRLRFKHSLVDDGSTFADTPGFGDANRAVAKIAEDYLRQAGKICLVTGILRTDTAALDDYLQQLIHMRKVKATVLLVNKIDVIDAKTGRGKHADSSDSGARVEAAKSHKSRLEHQKQELDQQKKQLQSAQMFEEFPKVDGRIKAVKREIKTADTALRHAKNMVVQDAILNRTARLQHALKDKLRKLAGPKQPDLRIHFLSAKDFDCHQYSLEDQRAQLDVAATGIPALRETFYEYAAHGKMQSLERIITRALPGEIKALLSVLTKTPWDRHQEVRTQIEVRFTTMSQIMLATLAADLKLAIAEAITHPFAQNSPAFRQKGQDLADRIAKLHAAKFQAFCKRNGKWKNSKGDEEDWNELARDILRETAEAGFSVLDHASGAAVKVFVSGVSRIFDQLREDLRVLGLYETASAPAFISAIDDAEQDLLEAISIAFDVLDWTNEDMRINTTIDKTPESFVGQAMAEAYAEANAIDPKAYIAAGQKKVRSKKGEGPHADRLKIICNALTGPDNVFTAVEKILLEVATRGIENCTAELEKTLNEALEHILQSFDNHFQPEEPSGTDDAVMLQKLQAVARNVEDELLGPIRQQLQAIKEWEKENAWIEKQS